MSEQLQKRRENVSEHSFNCFSGGVLRAAASRALASHAPYAAQEVHFGQDSKRGNAADEIGCG